MKDRKSFRSTFDGEGGGVTEVSICVGRVAGVASGCLSGHRSQRQGPALGQGQGEGHRARTERDIWSQMAEWLGIRASNQKVTGFDSRLCEIMLCPWARHLTLLASGRISL